MSSTTSNSQTPVILTTDDTLSPTSLPPTSTLAPLIPRSAIVEHRIKPRTAGVDLDSNKLSTTTIKRSQAISNIQDLDEDSPVTFEIEPNEHHHVRKKVHLQNPPIIHRIHADSISSFDKQTTTSSGGGDESDSRSESSEKTPEYIEEERLILPGIHVKGATLNRLIRILIDSFRKFIVFSQSASFSFHRLEINGTIIDDSEYPKVFFLMHKWIMESEHLSNMFYDLYKHYGDDYKKAIHSHDKQQYKDYQIRVCQVYW